MTSWKRITLVVFVLIGSTMFFRYWYLNQFNNTLDNTFSNLETALTANILSASSSVEKDIESISLSLETPTPEGLVEPTGNETTPEITSITTTAPVTATPADLTLSFDFPKQGAKLYIGCTYPISWQSSTIINTIEPALIDGGTKETKSPITSGLPKENTIEKDSQNLNWKVGAVWPGSYYIKVSKINGTDTVVRSKYFTINQISGSTSTEEREKICKESGGLF